MAAIYLHDHKEFSDLLRILEGETGILAGLIEKDYWIMKGFGLIDRFSEDMDLHINPPKGLGN